MEYNNYSYPQQGNAYAPQSRMNELTMTDYISKVMRRVFGKMFLGILVTAFVSLFVASSESLLELFFSSKIVFYGLLIAELGVVIFLSARLNKMSSTTATLLFYAYAVLTGVSLTPIFLVFTGAAIIKTFFITSGVFGAMAIYGYVTKSDLSKMGSILYMALFGLIIAIVVNIFLQSEMMDFVISIIGVILFTGLTAWDTQKIKEMAAQTDEQNAGKLATMGALSLYLDFINLFLYLLRIFGNRN